MSRPITHVLADGTTFSCTGTACRGVTFSNGQSFTLATALTAAASTDSSIFTGTLVTAALNSTVLPARDVPQRAHHGHEGGIQRARPSASPRTTRASAARSASRRANTQRRFVDYATPNGTRLVEVTLRGSDVLSVVMLDVDPVTSEVAHFACRTTACTQATVAGRGA